MKQHRKMFQYVEEMLYSYDRRKGDKSKNKIEYDRYAHTLRVYQWMLRITRELKDDSLDVESLKIATIFHDVGYAVQGDEGHAKESAAICRDYLERRPYTPEQIDFICYLILEHPNKRLLHEKTTPLELVVLMEADMLRWCLCWSCGGRKRTADARPAPSIYSPTMGRPAGSASRPHPAMKSSCPTATGSLRGRSRRSTTTLCRAAA